MLGNIIVNELIFVIVLVLGITSLTIEIFVPSFGLIGLAGIYLIFEAIAATRNIDNPMLYIFISIIVSVVVSIILIKTVLRSKISERLVLKNTIDKKSGTNSKKDHSFLLGQKAKVVKKLRPSGTINYDGNEYDALSNGEFIDVGEEVVINKIEGSIIYCARV